MFSDSENNAGRKQKGEGKGVFCRRGEGGGWHKNGRRNFLTFNFDITPDLINAILLLQLSHRQSTRDQDDDDFFVPALCLAKEGGGGTEGQCFTLLYVALRASQEPFDVHPLCSQLLLSRDLG